MIRFDRLRSLFRRAVPSAVPTPAPPPEPRPVPGSATPPVSLPVFTPPLPGPLPHWLADEARLRNEGVYLGLSDAHPDDWLAAIRAAYAGQMAHLNSRIDLLTEQLRTEQAQLDERRSQLATLRGEQMAWQQQHPAPVQFLRPLAGLSGTALLAAGAFVLTDTKLYEAYPSHLITGSLVLVACLWPFNRTAQRSVSQPAHLIRLFMAEGLLPLAAALFVWFTAAQRLGVWQAGAIAGLLLLGYLVVGQLAPRLLRDLDQALDAWQQNRQLQLERPQQLARLTGQQHELLREIDRLMAQKAALRAFLQETAAELSQQEARRDGLIHLFLGEFALARSLRERLTESQRAALFS